MTKNEMVDIMYKWINDKSKWVESCSYYDDYYSIDSYDVEKLLDVIIEAGMLAPRVESAYKKWGFNPYIENNYWEEEDGSN